ncbi:hypothetical protein CVT25_004640 [Psilocybe cyanescens]|uniref:Uncharacterized protein n=1 Tax=Psilocybe cyanescens TaxID=93625 RepID=A0A409VT30_PSICY|nr:hypothetical protein CVT25_004640 [Psilocybe cyanescens]
MDAGRNQAEEPSPLAASSIPSGTSSSPIGPASDAGRYRGISMLISVFQRGSSNGSTSSLSLPADTALPKLVLFHFGNSLGDIALEQINIESVHKVCTKK